MDSRRSGIGLFAVIGIVFVVLKLTGSTVIATWSWWVILLPFYGPIVLILVFSLIATLIGLALSSRS